MPKVTKSHWVLVNVKQHWAEGEKEKVEVEAGEGEIYGINITQLFKYRSLEDM